MLRGLSRRHFLEIHEQPWCPVVIRDGATDYLRFIAATARQYKRTVPLLRAGINASRSDRIVDLCSGGGGPWPHLLRDLEAEMQRPVSLLLTDLYPNRAADKVDRTQRRNVEFLSDPVDATRISTELTGFRTLFTAFHHFSPQDARAILQDAVDNDEGIGIFEQTERTPLALVMMLVLPWLAMLAAPFVRPFRIDRLFWTWIIPAIPFVLCFDGIVSCLRTYSAEELHTLVSEVEFDSARYRWEIGRVSSPLSPIGVRYLLGYPVREPSGDQSERVP
jgi:hypothetical protein